MEQTIEGAQKKAFSLCRKTITLSSDLIQLQHSNLAFQLFESIDEIADDWDTYAIPETFAKSAYLKTIELDSPDELKNLYVLVKTKEGHIVGTVLLQSLTLKFKDSFKYENYTTNRSAFSKRWQRIRQAIVSRFQFKMLTVGNLYLTGQYGFHFSSLHFTHQEQVDIVDQIVRKLRKQLSKTNYRFSGLLYKDYFEAERFQNYRAKGLLPFSIDPNMILPLNVSWNSFDDYLLDMRSKYRIRMKNAMKKFKGIERRVMKLEDVKSYQSEMYQLYNKILDGSGFVLAKGEEGYFVHLKELIGDDLHITGYFLEDRMVGFYTWVIDDGKMDSHFIGVEPTLNMRHQIYLNILLDLVKDSIGVRAKELYYYRTALEIKSSVGAEPFDMWCYFRHNNWLINKYIIPTAFKYFVPQQNWVQRHPFKSQVTTG